MRLYYGSNTTGRRRLIHAPAPAQSLPAKKRRKRMSTLPKESSSVNGQPLPNGHPAPNGLAQLNDVLATYPSLAELFRRMADPRDQQTVGELIGLYLEDAKGEIDPRT